ncbi:MAG: AAA family ATPase, partial [Fimbriiglobus sp.]
DKEHESAMLAAAVGRADGRDEPAAPVLSAGELAALQDEVAAVAVAPAVQGYLVDLGHATRQHPRITLGLSPRGLLTWQRVAQAWAFLRGRPFVSPDDVKTVADPVLGVRLGTDGPPADVIRELLASVPVPVYPV